MPCLVAKFPLEPDPKKLRARNRVRLELRLKSSTDLLRLALRTCLYRKPRSTAKEEYWYFSTVLISSKTGRSVRRAELDCGNNPGQLLRFRRGHSNFTVWSGQMFPETI